MYVGSVISLVCLFCTCVFVIMGIVSLKTKDIAQFWIKDNIKIDWVKDIKMFNREVARLWFCLALPFFLGIFIALIWPTVAGVIILGPGLILAVILTVYYHSLKDRYVESNPRIRRHNRRLMSLEA